MSCTCYGTTGDVFAKVRMAWMTGSIASAAAVVRTCARFLALAFEFRLETMGSLSSYSPEKDPRHHAYLGPSEVHMAEREV